jgi:hypothetical protein
MAGRKRARRISPTRKERVNPLVFSRTFPAESSVRGNDIVGVLLVLAGLGLLAKAPT